MSYLNCIGIKKEFWKLAICRLRSERFRRLSTEGLWIILGQVMAVSGSLLGVRLLTELLEPAQYGELALGMTVATLAQQVILGPLAQGVIRFYAPAQESGALQPYLAAVFEMVWKSTGWIILVGFMAGAGMVLTGHSCWMGLGLAALCFALFSGYNSILNGIQNAARQRSVVALHQGGEPWIRFPAAAGLILWLGTSSTVTMIGFSLAMVIVIISQCFFFRRFYNANNSYDERETAIAIKSEWRAQIFGYSWPIASFGFFTWALVVSDRWALELFATRQDVGFYSVLFQLGYYPMSMSSGMAMQLFVPIFFGRAGDAKDQNRNRAVHKLIWRISLMIFAIMIAGFVITLFFHALIFDIFVAKEFGAISYLLPWMLLSSGLFSIGQLISSDIMSKLKTQALMLPKIVTALAGILFNLLGAYFYGLVGVVASIIVFSICYLLWMSLLSLKLSDY